MFDYNRLWWLGPAVVVVFLGLGAGLDALGAPLGVAAGVAAAVALALMVAAIWRVARR